jgi:hypothetical protein
MWPWGKSMKDYAGHISCPKDEVDTEMDGIVLADHNGGLCLVQKGMRGVSEICRFANGTS